jgi:hypothetical protein
VGVAAASVHEDVDGHPGSRHCRPSPSG